MSAARFLIIPAALVAVIATAALARQNTEGATAALRFWPQWRGPFATGVSRSAAPPTEWSETKNIRWKVEIPGRGRDIIDYRVIVRKSSQHIGDHALACCALPPVLPLALVTVYLPGLIAA